jgi:hypothetical protein
LFFSLIQHVSLAASRLNEALSIRLPATSGREPVAVPSGQRNFFIEKKAD